jgi:putative transposase
MHSLSAYDSQRSMHSTGTSLSCNPKGTNRQKVFFSTSHREIYLSLVARHLVDTGVKVLAYCFSLSNHVPWVVVPERADSLAVLFRRVHGAYEQAVNAGLGRADTCGRTGFTLVRFFGTRKTECVATSSYNV